MQEKLENGASKSKNVFLTMYNFFLFGQMDKAIDRKTQYAERILDKIENTFNGTFAKVNSDTLRFFIKFVSRANCSNSYPPTK